MHILFIYGAPATGKYTVAKELQSITGYKLFHNHLTADMAGSVFDFGTKEYSDLSMKLRVLLVNECIKNEISGLIMTYAYGLETYKGKYDDNFIDEVIKANSNGKTTFIKLECSKDEQLKRLTNPSRKNFKKITDKKILENIEKKYDTNKNISFVDSVVIDNSNLSPEITVKNILKLVK